MTATVPDNEFGFTFAGVHSREFNIRVVDIRRNPTPTLEENLQSVPGMVGDISQGLNIRSKVLNVDIKIVADSHEQRVELITEICEWLLPLANGEFDLVFDDEIDFTYYAHITNIAEVAKQLYSGTSTITFSCPDPMAYGEQVDLQLTENPATITPAGSSPIKPIFTCIPSQDVTKIAVTDDKGNYAYVGSDVDLDTQQSPVDNMPRVVNDACDTFGTGWNPVPTSPTFKMENAVISGSSGVKIQSYNGFFSMADYNNYGSPVAGQWHGAGTQLYFPATYQDFRVRARLYNIEYYPRARGKIEIYLLNSQGKRIGRMYLKDNSTGDDAYALAEIGDQGNTKTLWWGEGTTRDQRNKTVTIKVPSGTKTVTVSGKKKTVQVYRTINLQESLETGTFTDFYGYIQIQKIGNVFSCEIMKLDQNANPAWSKPITATYTDKSGQYTDAIAGVALYIGKWDMTEDLTNPVTHYTNNHMGLTNLEVWNILNGGVNPDQSPTVIARAGDEIKINCEDGQVYKNGAIFMNNFYIGSNMPKMQGGVPNTFAFEPSVDQAQWFIDYRPTHK